MVALAALFVSQSTQMTAQTTSRIEIATNCIKPHEHCVNKIFQFFCHTTNITTVHVVSLIENTNKPWMLKWVSKYFKCYFAFLSSY